MTQAENRAAIYARTATPPQFPQPNPLEVQITECRSYCEKQGYRVNDTHIYQEVFSGAEINTRPQLSLLRASAKLGEFDIVIVYDYSRIARKLTLITFILTELERHGVSVESVREQFPESVVGQLSIYARVATKEKAGNRQNASNKKEQ